MAEGNSKENLRPNHPEVSEIIQKQSLKPTVEGEMSEAMQVIIREHTIPIFTADFQGKALGHLWGKHPKH